MSSWFDAEDHADRALEMYERGRWAEAEAELRKALALNPDQPEWHFNLGLTLEAAQREREALACYERSVVLMPGQLDPLLAAGIVANRLGHYDRAVDWLGQAIRIDNQCESAYAHQIEGYVRLGRHEEAETTFYLAQQALEDRSAHCLAMIAESLIARGQYERAEWCLWEAIRIDPALPRLRARLGAVYSATGRARKALQLYLRDLRDDPGNIDTLLDYGEALVELGRLPEAAEKFRRVLELEPANVDAHFRLGQIALQAGRSEQAHLEFELVLKLDPRYPQIRSSLASALLRRGRLDDARKHLRDEVAGLDTNGEDDEFAEPAEGPDMAGLGALLLEGELFTEAAEVFERAVRDDAADPELWRKLALARYRCGDRDGGITASRRALRLDPRCVISMHNLALAALEEGRYRTAAGWISRGRRIDRHDEELGRLRLRLWWLRLARFFRRG
ncbi:MAG: tetratricopeptide repeat protein [Planctomycetota bacterium]|jgi:tetratricopeptide (TPR) repeat protein